MRQAKDWLADPRMVAAADELRALINSRYSGTAYELAAGDDPEGLYMLATVDIDNPDVVVDLIFDRLMELQIDEGLPLSVIPIRTPERRAATGKPAAMRQRGTV